MAQIVLGGALSHSPLMNYPIPTDAREDVDAYREAAWELGQRFRSAGVDVLLVFAPDHFHAHFYDNMPAFQLGLGAVSRTGGWRGTAGPLEVAPELALHLANNLFENGFEPSVSYDMQVDHGTSQVLELTELLNLPIVPIFINCAAPPLPSPARCYDFGAALHGALCDFSPDVRVGVLGSGGLSHNPPGVSIESKDPEHAGAIQYMIHGRGQAEARQESRINMFLRDAQIIGEDVNPEWDNDVLDWLIGNRARELSRELKSEGIRAQAGAGGQEVRTWLAAIAASGEAKVERLFYKPVSCLITGMGMIAIEPQKSIG